MDKRKNELAIASSSSSNSIIQTNSDNTAHKKKNGLRSTVRKKLSRFDQDSYNVTCAPTKTEASFDLNEVLPFFSSDDDSSECEIF
eukprot:Awhi_evm1s9086